MSLGLYLNIGFIVGVILEYSVFSQLSQQERAFRPFQVTSHPEGKKFCSKLLEAQIAYSDLCQVVSSVT